MNKRTRNNSLYHPNHMHCPQDVICRPCCPCVQKLQMQIKILMQKKQNAMKQNRQKEDMLLKLTKQLKQWQQKGQQLAKLQDFKQKVRKSIKKQVQQQNKIDNFLMKQKFQSMKCQKKELQRSKQLLQQQIQKIKHIQNKNQQKVKQLEQHISQINTEKHQQSENLQKHTAQIQSFKNTIKQLENIIEDKTNIISKLQNAISQTDQYIILQKNKNHNIQFQTQKIQQTLKAKQYQLVSLQKTAQEKTNNIQNLTVQKQKLNKLVIQLDSTINSYSELSNKLRERVLISQDYATMKQIEAKKMQIDLYDSLYRFPLV